MKPKNKTIQKTKTKIETKQPLESRKLEPQLNYTEES